MYNPARTTRASASMARHARHHNAGLALRARQAEERYAGAVLPWPATWPGGGLVWRVYGVAYAMRVPHAVLRARQARYHVAYTKRVHRVPVYGPGLAGWLAYWRASLAMRLASIPGCPHGPRCGCTGPVLWPVPNRPAGPVQRVSRYAWWCACQAIAQRASLPGRYPARVAYLWRTTGPSR